MAAATLPAPVPLRGAELPPPSSPPSSPPLPSSSSPSPSPLLTSSSSREGGGCTCPSRGMEEQVREAEALAYLLRVLADPAPPPEEQSFSAASFQGETVRLSARVGPGAPPKLELDEDAQGPPQLSPVDSEGGLPELELLEETTGEAAAGEAGVLLMTRRESSLFGPGLLEALLGGGETAPSSSAPRCPPPPRSHHHHQHARTIRTCKECNKVYTTREGLRLHMRNMHLDDKQHVCEKCDMRFVRGGDLKLHLIRVHEPASARPCRCPFPGCEKAFACKSELTRHCKIHNRPASSSAYEPIPVSSRPEENPDNNNNNSSSSKNGGSDDDEDYNEGDDNPSYHKRVRSTQS